MVLHPWEGYRLSHRLNRHQMLLVGGLYQYFGHLEFQVQQIDAFFLEFAETNFEFRGLCWLVESFEPIKIFQILTSASQFFEESLIILEKQSIPSLAVRWSQIIMASGQMAWWMMPDSWRNFFMFSFRNLWTADRPVRSSELCLLGMLCFGLRTAQVPVIKIVGNRKHASVPSTICCMRTIHSSGGRFCCICKQYFRFPISILS